MKLARTELDRAILALARQRTRTRSFCPSEIARALACEHGDWRALMPAVRAAACALEAEGRLVWLQHGQRIRPTDARGPVRLRLP